MANIKNVFDRGDKPDRKNEGYFSIYTSNGIKKAELYMLLDKQPIAIIVSELEGTITFANISALSLTGYANLYGKTIDSLIFNQRKTAKPTPKKKNQVYTIIEHKSKKLIPVFIRNSQIEIQGQNYIIYNLLEKDNDNSGIKDEVDDYLRNSRVLEKYGDPKDPSALTKLIDLSIQEKVRARDRAIDNIVLEKLLESIYIIRKEGEILETNSKAQQSLGYTKNEILEKNFFNLLKPDDEVYFKNKLTSLNNENEVSVNLELLCKNKSFKKVKLIAYLRSSENQELVFCMVRETGYSSPETIKTDATIVIEGNKENLFSEVFKISPSPMFILNSNFKVIKYNYAAIVGFGIIEAYQKEKFLCQVLNCSAYINETGFSPDDESCSGCGLFACLNECSASGLPVVRKGFSIKTLKEGSVRDVQHLISVVPFGSGGNKHLLVTLDDIVERKKMEQELIQAKALLDETEKVKNNFIQNLSHEIRTPLNGIMGFSEVLIHSTSPENIRRFANRINQSGRRLLHVVQDMITVSSILTKSVKIKKEIIPLAYLIDETKALMSEELGDSENQHVIGLKLTVPDELNVKEICVDTTIFKAIVRSLFKNACKYTKDGIVEFGLIDTEKNENTFYIKDTGKGIDNDRQELIRNFLSSSSLNYSRETKGIGTGLSTSKYLIELTNGRLWFETSEEEGTIFYFSCSDYFLRGLDKNLLENRGSMLKGVTILFACVDDNTFDLYNYLLLSNGANIIRIKSGEDVIETIESGIIAHIILMDINLPDMGGLETSKQVLSIDPDMKIILQSAFMNSGDISTAKEYGCVDFIEKPVVASTLITKISDAVSTA